MSLSVPAATEADFPFNAQGRLFFSPLIFAREKVAEVLRRCCRNINLRNVWLQRTDIGASGFGFGGTVAFDDQSRHENFEREGRQSTLRSRGGRSKIRPLLFVFPEKNHSERLLW